MGDQRHGGLAKRCEHALDIVELRDDIAREQHTIVVHLLRLFYGCSYMHHLSGNNRRDSHFMGS